MRAVGVAIAASLAFSAAAEAKIIVGQSIHGVKLGVTRPQVRAHLGRGTRTRDNPDIFTYRNDSYQVIFQRGKVTSVETFSAKERTPRGFGVGTSRTTLKRRQPGIHCRTDSAGDVDCYVGSIKRGHLYTDFFFAGGSASVTAVVVGAGYT